MKQQLVQQQLVRQQIVEHWNNKKIKRATSNCVCNEKHNSAALK